MLIYDKLVADMKAALKSGDKSRLATVRTVRAAVQKAMIDGGTRDEAPDDAFVESILSKQAKMRREAIDQYTKADRPDLATVEADELAIIESYLPEQLDDESIRSEVQAIVDKTGATSSADFGKVMGLAMKSLKGRADGKRVQVAVRELLAAE